MLFFCYAILGSCSVISDLTSVGYGFLNLRLFWPDSLAGSKMATRLFAFIPIIRDLDLANVASSRSGQLCISNIIEYH